ncbi:MAG: spore germination protein, partial [Clostridia bacterium]|nr:spore germination protein [Clostridia bacterium]
SLALYHQGILSTEVLSTVVASRRMVFEPIGAELILLLIIFQLIREAGQRVPGSIGQAIGIIGGLIMGQAAVSAHLASSVVLIIVAASGLGNFCIPDYRTQLAASYIRLAFVVSAWLGGLLGMTSALIVMLARLASIESFGMPYLAPLSPKRRAARPALFRGPITGGAIGRASGKSEDVM